MHPLLSLGGWLLLHHKAQPVPAHSANTGCNGCRSPLFNTNTPPSYISGGRLTLQM